MNKNDIKVKWGRYIDTDKLVEDVMSLLTKYNHRNTEHGVCCILEEFFTKKEPLIKLLQKSNHYAGDLRVVLDEELERRCDPYELQRWLTHFLIAVKPDRCIKKRTDEHNKTIDDYMKVGITRVSVADLENEEVAAKFTTRSSALRAFTSDGFTVASTREYDKFNRIMDRFERILTSSMEDEIADTMSEYKVRRGMKTSRAFNAVCKHFGVDQSPETTIDSRGKQHKVYDSEFAKYADMVSDKKRQIKFFISVNPIDYLTMSFGVNWSSCHTIDKMNLRGTSNGHGGAYCAGTMSYMLDSTSVVTYVYDTMPENYEVGKVYRNMFHIGGDGVLLQGRIYPQGNDGCTDLYQEFRAIMQKELAQMLGLESNLWTKRKSISNVNSIGQHYRDYDRFSYCNMSYPSERLQCQHQTILIGSRKICPHCGAEADEVSSHYLSHNDCV